ncbi:MAG: hypothetical protein ACE3JK_01855 [Sporolactobacillus sp.]
MSEIEERIAELEGMYATSKRVGMHPAESWLFSELVVMKSRLNRMKKASAATEAV